MQKNVQADDDQRKLNGLVHGHGCMQVQDLRKTGHSKTNRFKFNCLSVWTLKYDLRIQCRIVLTDAELIQKNLNHNYEV